MRLVALALLAGCTVTVNDGSRPLRPATPPIRLAIAPIKVTWQTPDRSPAVDARQELTTWLDGWYGVAVVPFDVPELAPELASEWDKSTVRRICATAKAAHVDALLLASLQYNVGQMSNCERNTRTWSTNPQADAPCVKYSESTHEAAFFSLTYRVITTATCGLSSVMHHSGMEYWPKAWSASKIAVRHDVPDAARAEPQTVLGDAAGACFAGRWTGAGERKGQQHELALELAQDGIAVRGRIAWTLADGQTGSEEVTGQGDCKAGIAELTGGAVTGPITPARYTLQVSTAELGTWLAGAWACTGCDLGRVRVKRQD